MNPPRPSLTVSFIYGAVTVLFGYPLLRRLGTAVPNDLGDPLLNTWILWWNSRAIPLTADWWNAPAFFPARDALAFSEHLVGLSPLTTPVIWLGGSPLLAYNITFLLTFALSAMGAYLLALTIAKRHDVAFVAGLAYGFAPYRMAQLAHVQVLASFWMPLALAALHRYVDDRRPRWLVLFAAATALQGLTNGYYLFFFPVLIGLWVMWFSPPGRRLATAGAAGGSLAAASVVYLPFLLHYRAAHEWFRLERFSAEVGRFSAGLDDLLHASADLVVWGRWLGTSGREDHLFPGLTCLLLLVAAAVWAREDPGADRATRGLLPRRVRLGLAVAASLLSLVALSRLLLGPWRLELLGAVVSTGKLSKPLTLTVYSWVGWALTGPSVRRVVRSRSPLVFYSVATVAMWIFSFGPAPTIGDVEILYWAPYRWLTLLPGFDGLRVPARFAMLAVLCLSTAAALALGRLRSRVSPRAGVLLVAVASAGILAEGWREIPLQDPPPGSVLSDRDESGAVMELPLGRPLHDVQAMYRGIQHHHPVVNGYSGHEPAHSIVLRLALPREEPEVLQELATRGVRSVVVFKDQDRSRRWRRYVRSLREVKRVRGAGNQVLFSLPDLAPAAKACEGPPLPVTGVTASVSPEGVARALDGDPDTRWHTGRPQQPGDEIVVELGAVEAVAGVELALGPHYGDFPRRLVVEASLDERSWKVLWDGPTGALALAAAIETPRSMPLRVCFPPARARHVRLRQLGRAPRFGWTVAELVVLGEHPTGSRTRDDGARGPEP